MKPIIASIFCICLALPAWAQEVILARNQWTTVTKADFEQEIARIPKDQQFQYLASAERVARTVEGILVTKTLAAQAREAGIHEEAAVKAEIAAATEKILARHRTERVGSRDGRSGPGKTCRGTLQVRFAQVHGKGHRACDAHSHRRALPQRAMPQRQGPWRRVPSCRPESPSRTSHESTRTTLPQRRTEATSARYSSTTLHLRSSKRSLTLKPGELERARAHEFRLPRHSARKREEGAPVSRFARVRESIIAEVKDDWLKQQRKEFIRQSRLIPSSSSNWTRSRRSRPTSTRPSTQPKRPG